MRRGWEGRGVEKREPGHSGTKGGKERRGGRLRSIEKYLQDDREGRGEKESGRVLEKKKDDIDLHNGV